MAIITQLSPMAVPMGRYNLQAEETEIDFATFPSFVRFSLHLSFVRFTLKY